MEKHPFCGIRSCDARLTLRGKSLSKIRSTVVNHVVETFDFTNRIIEYIHPILMCSYSASIPHCACYLLIYCANEYSERLKNHSVQCTNIATVVHAPNIPGVSILFQVYLWAVPGILLFTALGRRIKRSKTRTSNLKAKKCLKYDL